MKMKYNIFLVKRWKFRRLFKLWGYKWTACVEVRKAFEIYKGNKSFGVCYNDYKMVFLVAIEES